MRQRIYVWQIPVRLTHWVNAFSILVLSVTGYFIGNPWLFVARRETYASFFMGTVRFIHFAAAFIFLASVLLRTYWAVAGNPWSSWRGLFPILTKRGRQGMRHAFQYYFFLRRDPPETIGHNALAGMTYALIVTFYGLIIFSGLALFGQLHPESVWANLTGWIFQLLTSQQIRLIHHVIMYLLIVFAVYHIYVAWLIDMEEANGLMSSMFSGFKFLRRDQAPDWIEPEAQKQPAPTKASSHAEKASSHAD
ncbi:MAG: Ni/Fe-hydrogenase, b-type cytochrome subunit [Oscillochloris sp.]|nr:Ni/Fe-hydrogenase, b-type cytochrome subunit [Oscillochloris sp.]